MPNGKTFKHLCYLQMELTFFFFIKKFLAFSSIFYAKNVKQLMGPFLQAWAMFYMWISLLFVEGKCQHLHSTQTSGLCSGEIQGGGNVPCFPSPLFAEFIGYNRNLIYAMPQSSLEAIEKLPFMFLVSC